MVELHDKIHIAAQRTTHLSERTGKALDYQEIFRHPVVVIGLPQFMISLHIERLELFIAGKHPAERELPVHLPQRPHGVRPEIPYRIVQVDKQRLAYPLVHGLFLYIPSLMILAQVQIYDKISSIYTASSVIKNFFLHLLKINDSTRQLMELFSTRPYTKVHSREINIWL